MQLLRIQILPATSEANRSVLQQNFLAPEEGDANIVGQPEFSVVYHMGKGRLPKAGYLALIFLSSS
jgi:hypothetical protein